MPSPAVIWRYVEQERFVEALYFGALALAVQPTADLHLALGVACCGACKPLAQYMREFHPTAPQEQAHAVHEPGLRVTRDTLLVHEGLYHLVQARRLTPDVSCPVSCGPVVTAVLRDLQDYARDDYRDVGAQRHLVSDFRTIAYAAILLLARIQGLDPGHYLSGFKIALADKLLANVEPSELRAAAATVADLR